MSGSLYKAWKALERRHAKRMKGKRLWRPDYSDSIPDGESTTETWDAKAYARHSVVSMYLEAEAKYRAFTGDRRFHLVLFSRDRPQSGDFVLVRAEVYAQLAADADRAWKGDGTFPEQLTP